MSQHELHPLCTLFPRINGADFEALKADIAANGLRQPIVLHDGLILDGGNRYRACIETGIKPTFTKFAGGNIASFVLSANMHRRHLSAGQQAAIVSSIQAWNEAQPASRPKKECNVAPLKTVADRAAESGASIRTQKMADKVAKASPELSKQVAHGEISLPKAVAKVENKPQAAPKAAKPKTPEVTIESLQAENAALREEISVLQDNNRELASLVESYDAVTAGEHEAAKAMNTLRAQLRTVEATRDQWMTTASELRREVKGMQAKAKRGEK